MAEVLELGGRWVLRCDGDGPVIDSEAKAADLIGEALGEGARVIAVPVGRLGPNFFNLRTGIAGMIAQKVVNYRLTLAVTGDITAELATSNALRDWVRETNKGDDVWFLRSFEDLVVRLEMAAAPR